MRRLFWYLVITLLIPLAEQSNFAFAREAKESDADVNYDESRTPNYALPQLLLTAEGTPVTTAKQWHTVRRPQIASLFCNLVYGCVPEPASPIQTTFEVVGQNDSCFGGKATRKDVKIRFRNDRGSEEMHILVFVPNDAVKPVPAMLKQSFNNTQSNHFKEHLFQSNNTRNGWPIGEWIDRGFGFVVVYHEDLIGHNEVGFGGCIHRLFYPEGQSFPKAHEWGVLATVAWGGSRALDYLETDPDIDATRVAVMGHSKMGKAALWTAARDERFALAVSAQSGCAGAALWRRKSGETLKKMVTRFPYWLCRNAWKFVEQEDDLPVDQHMLLAMIAPRPVYVASGIEDTWADPRGEYASAYHASIVYELMGLQGLDSEEFPQVGTVLANGHVGYHLREGGHSVELYDWRRFMDFCEEHLK